MFFFFFSSRRRHTRFDCDWSSDVCSSDLFAEEKRSGTIELLVTSPIRDIEIIVGKWLAAVILYMCMLGLSMLKDRKSTRLNSSHSQISYAVFCLKKKKKSDIDISVHIYVM